MRLTKVHSGNFYCSPCDQGYEAVDVPDQKLKCPDCNTRLEESESTPDEDDDCEENEDDESDEDEQ